jgi:hypothetical protein
MISPRGGELHCREGSNRSLFDAAVRQALAAADKNAKGLQSHTCHCVSYSMSSYSEIEEPRTH